MYLAKVYVTLKPTVNDPQGQTVLRGLKMLGFASVRSVRIGKYLEMQLETDSLEAASKQVAQMCQRLLANMVIEEYSFELEETP